MMLMIMEFTPINKKRNHIRYARKSGNESTMIPKRMKNSEKKGIRRE
jgi:hypothetical protein